MAAVPAIPLQPEYAHPSRGAVRVVPPGVYEQQLASPDKLNFALVEVMTFGWSNCANALIPSVEYDGTQDKEFKKLFKSVKKVSCDEP